MSATVHRFPPRLRIVTRVGQVIGADVTPLAPQVLSYDAWHNQRARERFYARRADYLIAHGLAVPPIDELNRWRMRRLAERVRAIVRSLR